MCNLSLKYQIRKLGDTKYQTGKYQIGKYLASFAWTSVAQLAEVSKPGIARERDGQGDFSTARNLPSSSWAGSQASTGARRPRWLRWRPASRTAPNSLGGAAAPWCRNMGSRQRGRFMKCNEIREKLNCFGGLEVFLDVIQSLGLIYLFSQAYTLPNISKSSTE